MPDPLLQDLMATPVTGLTCLVLCLIWFPLWNYRVPVDHVAFSFSSVVTQGEWWRVMTAAHSHFDLVHLGFNVMSLWSCRVVELMLGPWQFFVQSIALVVLSKCLMLVVVGVVSPRLSAQQGRAWADGMSVGYSAVIFAWMTVLSAHTNSMSSVFGLIDVPSQAMPVVSLLITQLLVRNASFIGHAAGIVAGALAVVGLLDWLQSPYWAGCFFFWVAVMLAYSLKATTSVPMPCIEYVNRLEEGMTGGNGGGGGGGGGGGSGGAPQRMSMLQPQTTGNGHVLGGGRATLV